jgi:hypothetical protein
MVPAILILGQVRGQSRPLFERRLHPADMIVRAPDWQWVAMRSK